MTALVLTQPMLLPWRGLFEQAMLADHFVYHDNIQLPKSHGKAKSFQTRVQIKTAGGWEWLSLPVDSKSPTSLIKDARLASNNWRKVHLDQIRKAYRTAPHFAQVFEELVKRIYALETDLVAEFCMFSMNEIMRYVGIDVPLARTSDLPIGDELAGSRRVLEHCLLFKADRYITGLGALEYIDYDLFEEHRVKIEYMQYTRRPYPQIHGEFNPSVSTLDLLFNVGRECREYLGSPAVYWRELNLDLSKHSVK